MSSTLHIRRAGPGLTVQDLGRPGHLAHGLSVGGAADPVALHEGAALLGQPPDTAALEMAGSGGSFAVDAPVRIALTGAAMQASLDGVPLAWHASHLLSPGQTLNVGAARGGLYGYLHVGGGIAIPPLLGSRSAHLTAGIGRALAEGDSLPLGDDPGGGTGLALDPLDRFGGGTVRIVPSMQTHLFARSDLDRLEATAFTRDPRGNRMGARMRFDGPPFAAEGQLDILSDIITPGDVQATGDGAPFVLLVECQTTGGYPRLATVIPPDLPIVAQARPGDPIRFAFISRDDGLRALRDHARRLADLPRAVRPRIRDPHDIDDLLSYQLIGGVTAGEEP